MSITLDISREEVLQLAAQRLADDAAGEEHIGDRVQQLITKRVNDAVAQALEGKIEEVLSRKMEHILRETITPINIWGERAGAPTTLRDALAERARVFWDVKVDKEGKPSDYHGRPRHEHLMARLLNEEFTKAIRDNATAMVAAFASAVKADSARITAEHIDKLVNVKTR